jgi:hypothetical protein
MLTAVAPLFLAMLPPIVPQLRPLPAMNGLPALAPYQKVASPIFPAQAAPLLNVMLPLLTLPTLIDDPGRVFAGQSLSPLFQSGQVGQLLRGSLLYGTDPHERDSMLRSIAMPTALFSQLANSAHQMAKESGSSAAPLHPELPIQEVNS